MRKMWYADSMKKNWIKQGKKFITVVGLATAVLTAFLGDGMTALASSIGEVQNQIDRDKKDLDKINGTISGLSDEQDLIEEEIEDLNSEVQNMFTSIGLKEDEIAEKKDAIAQKQVEIGQAQVEYEAAKKREEEQYDSMKSNIRFMFENNDTNFLVTLLGSGSFSEFLNMAEYTELVYQYDQKMLEDYKATKEEVQTLWNRLEADKDELEIDERQLEEDKAKLQELKDELDRQLEQKKKESADFEAEIAKYKKQANAAKKKIQEEEKHLKQLKEEEARRQQQNNSSGKGTGTASGSAANGSYKDTGYASAIDNAAGSELGKKIAKYACQFIGNPYVSGGTSLTNGADCSGFTYRVYKDFGYNLPRTSYEQRSAGKSVSYSEAQPGDIICYSGHVAIYIGGGKIVHASTSKTGIKIGNNAQYKTILSVRRII